MSSTDMPTTACNIAGIRTELLAAFLQRMNAAAIPYCLLNGFRGYPEVIASDVDFMVRPKDAKRIAPLLLEAAKQCGGLLVQAIRHETGAWYFVLAKQASGGVAYVHPDCSTDYRRDGRLWLAAEPVLGKRRPYKTFFVPAIADEFLYYLTKKTLKQRVTVSQMQHLTALYLSCPEECSDRIRRFWSRETAEALVSALMQRDIGWTRSHLPALLRELRQSVPVEDGWQRVKQGLREWRRKLERVTNPTGLGITVSGGTEQQRAELARAFEENLRPAFRRTMICAEETSRDGLWHAAAFCLVKVRSTLVIRRAALAKAGWLERDQIGFVLSNPGTGERNQSGLRNGCVVLDDGRSLEQNVEDATRVTLEYLAERLQRRMKLGGPSSTTREIEFVARRKVERGTRSAR